MAGVVRYQIMLGNTISEYASVSYTASTFQEIVIDTGTSDVQLDFGGVTTADMVYLESDQALTLNIQSSSGTDIPIDADKPFVLSGTAVTAVYVSNSSGLNANVVFKIWGA
jgi:hypothetical protein